MHPILFKIPIFGGIPIHTYGVLVALGFLAGMMFAAREAKRLGEDPAKAMDITFWIIVAAIIGSRIFYLVAEEPDLIFTDPLSLIKIWKGGLVFHGGVIGAFVVGWVLVKKWKLDVWRYMDIFAPAIPLGHVFGRLGCFMAGCCHGRPAGGWFAVTFPIDPNSFAPGGVPLYPTQLMEAVGELAIFLGLVSFRGRKSFDGQLMAIYFIAYGILRFIIEFFRADTTRGLIYGSMFSVAQVISIALIVVGVGMWIKKVKGESR